MVKPLGPGHWMAALALAVGLHGAVVLTVFREDERTGAHAPGTGGIEIALGMAGGAPGSENSPSGETAVEAAADGPATEAPAEDTPAEAPPEPVRPEARLPDPAEEAPAEETPAEVPLEPVRPEPPLPDPAEEAPAEETAAEAPPEPVLPEPPPDPAEEALAQATPAEALSEPVHPEPPLPDPAEEAPAEVTAAEAPPELVPPEPPLPPLPPRPPRRPAPVLQAEPVPAEAASATPPAADASLPPQAGAQTASAPSVAGADGTSGAADSPDTGNRAPDMSAGGLPGITADYADLLVAWLQPHKDYPRRAQARRQEGVVRLLVTIGRDGTLLEARIERGTGHRLLDRAALDTLERARPLPPLPAEVPGDRLDVIVPVHFFIGDSRR